MLERYEDSHTAIGKNSFIFINPLNLRQFLRGDFVLRFSIPEREITEENPDGTLTLVGKGKENNILSITNVSLEGFIFMVHGLGIEHDPLQFSVPEGKYQERPRLFSFEMKC